MKILAYILSGLSLLMSVLFLMQPKAPLGVMVWFPKLTARAFLPYLSWAYLALSLGGHP